MIFKDYVAGLVMLLADRPETGEFQVVSSKDDEGNGYNLVSYDPSVGTYDGDDNSFREERGVNAVCIN